MKKIWFKAAPLVCAGVLGLFSSTIAYGAELKLPEGLSMGAQSLAGMTAQQARDSIGGLVEGMGKQSVVLNVQGEKVNTTVNDLGFNWKNQDALEALLEKYTYGDLVQQYIYAEDLAREPVNLTLETEISEEAIRGFVEQHTQGLTQEGKNASIVRENGQFIVTPGVKGLTVDTSSTYERLQQALADGLGEPVEIDAVIAESDPAVTTEALESIQDVLGTFSTDFSSSGSSRSTNLRVGAEKINGALLMPGETLSGYERLQPFTTANGYKTAAAYENGQVVDSIGGGVCQIATTLYNTALLAELEITQRQNHSMTVSYVKPSRDAAIAGTYKDIKFTNNYDTPIYVEGYTQGRTLTFTIYGKETRDPNRQIEFISETLSRIGAGAPKTVVNPALPPGARKQVQSAHTGLRSRLWKVVKVNGVETERTLLSTDTYTASPAIVQVGPEVPAAVPAPDASVEPGPAAPTAPAPSETQPPETAPVHLGPGYQPETAAPAPSPEPAPAAPGPVSPAPSPEPAPAPSPEPAPAPAPSPEPAGPGAGPGA